MTSSLVTLPDAAAIASGQIAQFEAQYAAGEARSAMADLLAYAAFPMTLTTDLVCCLRENFAAVAPWYGAMDIVLSGLTRKIGYDLYEFDGAVRRVLLARLRHQPIVPELETFMVAYVAHRLDLEDPSDRARVFGDSQVSSWTALFCTGAEGAVVEQIRAALRHQMENRRDRLYWISMLRNYEASILPGTPLLQMVDDLRSGRPIDELAAIEQALGIQLKDVRFTTARVRVGDVAVQTDPNARQTFAFETVQVDRQGKIIDRKSDAAWGFVETVGDATIDMVAIRGGEFVMGSPPDEPERYDGEGPQHRVTVPPFFMGRYAVTQAQWRSVAGLAKVDRDLDPDPAEFKGDDRPVEQVSWLDATEFCARLSRETGREYRLPSEAEWEYACRAGTTTPFHFGGMISPAVANYDWDQGYDGVKPQKQSKQRGTMAVGSFAANPWGLYEMHGNVWEWCADDWHDNYEGAPNTSGGAKPNDSSIWASENAETTSRKVIRGGSWIFDPQVCRSAIRNHLDAVRASFSLGFRLVCAFPRTL
jgi:formylglycine-generating enzyme required for sulfatase activity